MTEIRNLTPHPIRIIVGDRELVFTPSGTVPRVNTTEDAVDPIDGIPCITRTLKDVQGLPESQDGVFLIVSSLVFEASSRQDLLCPDTGKSCIRDQNGNIIAVTRFIKKG